MYASPEEAFLRFDYMEAKDLLKTFITLISASLVLSVTLSERIGGFSTAPTKSKRALVMAWGAMIGSLICAGISTCLIGLAAEITLYGQMILFLDAATTSALSMLFILVSGCSYVGALILMTMAAYRSMMAEPAPKSWDL